jgi:hypothetical protein
VSEWTAFVTTKLLPFELLSLELGRAAVEGLEVLLTQASASGIASCWNTARELGDPARAPRSDESRSAANPATCLTQAWDARAESSGMGSGSGPTQDSLSPPTSVTGLSGTASASASATATPPISTAAHVREANAYATGAGGGEGHLRVQGQPVTMTVTGALSGYASFRASWAPSAGGAGGAGTAGSYLLDAFAPLVSGTLSHSVRLEPGQTIHIRYLVQASALAPPAPPGPSDHLKPGPGGGTASFTVSFTP